MHLAGYQAKSHNPMTLATYEGNPRSLASQTVGAQEGTRTLTPYGTRPSNVCVYQFHHLSSSNGERVMSGNPFGLSSPEIGF